MGNRLFGEVRRCFNILLLLALLTTIGCRSTKHIQPDQHLLRKNRINLSSAKVMTNRGEIKDNLYKLAGQKPNTYGMRGQFPFKLYFYNLRYKHIHNRPDSLLPKYVERPVLFDSSTLPRAVQNMKSYLFNQGYFYARVKDTVIYRKRKAYVSYNITAGENYLINRINYDIDDSAILALVVKYADGTVLKKGKEFAYSQLEEERSRVTSFIRNNGYSRFSQENVTFRIDTFDKSQFRVATSPFENAVNFIAQAKSNKKHTIDIDIVVRMAEDTLAYNKYWIRNVIVYPDYSSQQDFSDTTMLETTIGGIRFRYHNKYVHSKVLFEHIYLNPGMPFSQANYDKTIVKLTELGIFQYIRLQARENRTTRDSLDYNILLSRNRKHDFQTNYELSSGSTYSLGHAVGINYRDRNLMKGANLLSIGVNGGIELAYNENKGNNIEKHFDVLTKYYGVNASIDFPKFLAPIASTLFDNSNLPHTVISGGENVIDRVNYFTLLNTSATFSYNWRETQTKTWSLSPAFVNVIRVPVETDSFKKVLANNQYLANSYKENFIEGENIAFKFDNLNKKHGINYSYLRLGFEEAGGLLGFVNQLGTALNDLYKIRFAQYTKFDFDAGHYFTLPKAVFAFRLYGGLGLPYGQSSALPYIKQYFAGGPYSLRGWRIRTLGPGSYYDSTNTSTVIQIDRTGDIKLELNGEYRFPITPLFAGAIKMNGALFFDAGNIWLARKDSGYPGGEFELSTLGQDIATDLGAGTRFDIASFLTLRVDVAVPVKKPYVFENNGWVFKDIDFSNPTWRANNIIFNISIGYPF